MFSFYLCRVQLLAEDGINEGVDIGNIDFSVTVHVTRANAAIVHDQVDDTVHIEPTDGIIPVNKIWINVVTSSMLILPLPSTSAEG